MRYGNNTVFQRSSELYGENSASIKGVAIKSIIMLGVAILTSVLCMGLINTFSKISGGVIIFGYLFSPILTLILSFIMSFNPTAAKTLAIPYSILEGISIGTIAGLLTALLGEIGGVIVGLAFVITLSFFLGAAVLYATGLVKVGFGFRRFLSIALFGTVISSLIIAILGIFNPTVYFIFYGYGALSLVISIVYVLIAAGYSLITLDNAKRIVDAGLDAEYEWYAAFGIILNVIWLFYEVLRLIIILFARSDRN